MLRNDTVNTIYLSICIYIYTHIYINKFIVWKSSLIILEKKGIPLYNRLVLLILRHNYIVSYELDIHLVSHAVLTLIGVTFCFKEKMAQIKPQTSLFHIFLPTCKHKACLCPIMKIWMVKGVCVCVCYPVHALPQLETSVCCCFHHCLSGVSFSLISEHFCTPETLTTVIFIIIT